VTKATKEFTRKSRKRNPAKRINQSVKISKVVRKNPNNPTRKIRQVKNKNHMADS